MLKYEFTKNIKLINEILKDIIWDIYDELYKLNTTINIKSDIIFKENILKIKFCIERIYESNIYINHYLNILINDIVDDIKTRFYKFKKEIIQILEIENFTEYNIYNKVNDKVICFDTFLF